MRDAMEIEGFEPMQDEPGPRTISEGRIKWDSIFDAFLQSGYRRVRKKYPTEGECAHAYHCAYSLAYKHYIGRLAVMKRGDCLIIERQAKR